MARSMSKECNFTTAAVDAENAPSAGVADPLKVFSAVVAGRGSVLTGCSSAPGHSTICSDHEALCVVGGIAVFGGIVAVLNESGGDNGTASNP
jgi:hypothetical protein